LVLAFLLAGSSLCQGQTNAQPQTLPAITQPLPPLDLSLQTPDQLWQLLWPAWTTLKDSLQLQITQQQQQAQTQASSEQLKPSETQTTNDLQSNLQQASQAQNQASTSTTSATQSSTQSSTDLTQAQATKVQVDKAVKDAVANLEISRNGWKIAGITFGVVAIVEGIFITVKKAW